MEDQKNKLTIKEMTERLATVLSSIAMVITAIAELARVISLAIPTKEEKKEEE